jgi:hypothetical protein
MSLATTVCLRELVQRMLVEQRLDVLDRTKCSVTARNVYNWFAGAPAGGGVAPNDNLVGSSLGLDELEAALQEGGGGGAVFYVHFDHMCNDTSHYFVLVRDAGGQVLMLQSAVFEFSIRDWLFPWDAVREAADGYAQTLGNIVAAAPAPAPAPAPAYDARSAAALQQAQLDLARQASVAGRIASCRHSCGRASTAERFVADAMPLLRALEGCWAVEDVERHCRAYGELFACALQAPVVRANVANGFDKPARFRFQSAKLV